MNEEKKHPLMEQLRSEITPEDKKMIDEAYPVEEKKEQPIENYNNLTVNEIIDVYNAWPLPDVLAKLIEATDHLLNVRNYDLTGWEEVSHCVKRGREILAVLNTQKLSPLSNEREKDTELTSVWLLNNGYSQRSEGYYKEWFPFILKYIEDDEYLNGDEIEPYFALTLNKAILGTKIRTVEHLQSIEKAICMNSIHPTSNQ